MNKDALKKNFLELKELKHVLSKASYFLEEVRFNLEFIKYDINIIISFKLKKTYI